MKHNFLTFNQFPLLLPSTQQFSGHSFFWGIRGNNQCVLGEGDGVKVGEGGYDLNLFDTLQLCNRFAFLINVIPNIHIHRKRIPTYKVESQMQ